MKWKQFVGIGLVVLSVLAMVLWETLLRERVVYRSVPVCSSVVRAGDTVTPDMIKLVRITPESQIYGALDAEDVPGIIGQKAAVDLQQNQQLLAQYFSKEAPPQVGTASFVIDRSWICSQSILDEAGDTVSLYMVQTGDFLGSYRIKVLPSSEHQLELAAKLSDYLLIRAAAEAGGPGSIIVVNQVCK